MFLDNLGLKALSAVIAVALWVYVLDHENPITTRRVTLPVTAIAVPEGLAVMQITPDRIEVLLRGRQTLLDDTRLTTARAVVNMAMHDFGEHEAKVELVLPQGVNASGEFDVTVRVKLDTVVAKERPVVVEATGAPAEGYASAEASVRPPEITVRGPVAWIQRVSRVVAPIDISDQSATVKRLVPVEARDAGNVRIPGLRFTPDRVEVTIPIEKVNTRTVPITANVGPPAAGFAVSEVKVEPTSVTLAGKNQVESVVTEKIDISELRGTRTYSVPLLIPEGAMVLGMGIGSAHVTVTVVPSSGTARPAPQTGGSASPESRGEPAAKADQGGSRPGAGTAGNPGPPGTKGGRSDATPPETAAGAEGRRASPPAPKQPGGGATASPDVGQGGGP